MQTYEFLGTNLKPAAKGKSAGIIPLIPPRIGACDRIIRGNWKSKRFSNIVAEFYFSLDYSLATGEKEASLPWKINLLLRLLNWQHITRLNWCKRWRWQEFRLWFAHLLLQEGTSRQSPDWQHISFSWCWHASSGQTSLGIHRAHFQVQNTGTPQRYCWFGSRPRQ